MTLSNLHKPFGLILSDVGSEAARPELCLLSGCLKEVYVNDKLVDFLQAAKTRHKVRNMFTLYATRHGRRVGGHNQSKTVREWGVVSQTADDINNLLTSI